MTDTKCIDSSAWLLYYFGENETIQKIVDQESILTTSSLTLFEVKKKILSLHKNPELFLSLIKKRSSIIVPGIIIAETAAVLAHTHRLPTIDALIYATSLSTRSELITADNDFRGLAGVRML